MGNLKRFSKELGHGFLRSRDLQTQYGRDVYVRLMDLPRMGENCYIGQVFEFNVVFNANNKIGQMRAKNVTPISHAKAKKQVGGRIRGNIMSERIRGSLILVEGL